MSTRPHTPMAYRLAEDKGVKNLPMRRSGKRQALGVLMGGLFVLALGTPVQAREKVTFNTASLRGTYAYVNFVENVGSLGLITFYGNGALTADIKVNTPNANGGRTITPESGTGTYSVDPSGTGVAIVQFPTTTATYDFVITKVADQEMAKQDSRDQALATEVFAINEAGGLSGQLVAPFWKRINQP